MDKLIIITIPAAIYFVYRSYTKKIKDTKKLNLLQINTRNKICELQKKIEGNILEFKNNLNELNKTLENYYSQIDKIKNN